ncbi:GNAT family N-acetyltransferase [Yimella sp. cx-51]|uniref:GNAT family N-acetyltransferase n=1 Tax=Yimella sp. cx-51 TaxID=2770551 RepID=UPI00165E1D40|nr:GNAT family N-acetyltransferase [Yimella sp. cx-51]MBC9956574.1 N-acetyltransferase [Yimella sp. cx-51]QTH38325.1 N-acetyltransferase [Yimella sp. cx-51]
MLANPTSLFLDRDHEEVAERVFFHTEVDEEFGGRGLATILVREAIAATREAGKIIFPVCPLVRGVLTKNADEYEGALRQNRPADFAWVQEELAARKQG